MSLLSSLKRLFFTTESVAKSAAEKAVEYTKEKATDVVNVAKETVSDVTEKTSGLRESVMEKANAAFDKVEDVAESAWEKTKEVASDAVDKAKEMTSDSAETTVSNETTASLPNSEYVESNHKPTETQAAEPTSAFDRLTASASDIFDKTKSVASEAFEKLSENELVKKAGDLTENVGSKVMEVGSDLSTKAASASEAIGSKVMDASAVALDKLGDAKDALVDRAKVVSDQLGQKLDETMEKAEKFMVEENAKPKQEFSDKDLNAGKDLLEGKDDFFSKAGQYADGDYDAFSEGKIRINPKPVELPTDDNLDTDKFDDAIVVEDK